MLELEPVSKYRKDQYSKWAKIKQNKCFNSKHAKGFSLNYLQSIYKDDEQQCYQSRQFEDSYLTKFLYEQSVNLNLCTTLLALISILLSFQSALINFEESNEQMVLIMQTGISFGLIVLIVLKYFKGLELKEKQLIRGKRGNKYFQCLKSNIIQALVLIIHPNLLTKNVILQIEEPIYGTLTPFKVNNLLQMWMLSRIYLLYDSLIRTSIYCTPRANRMCRIYNANHEADFGIKSVFNAYPINCLCILTFTLVPILSRMLMLSEQNNPALDQFGNAVWCIIITMGTVGYGDYNPTSYLGRLIAFIAAISGIILTSLLILTLSEELAMSSKQSKSHITLRRLQLRKLLEDYAEEAIIFTSTMVGGNMSDELKKKTEKVKQISRRLKNMVDTDSLSQEINTLFDSLYGNLMEIYIQQKTYADELMCLYDREGHRIKQINFSFASEIEDIIRDR